MKKDIQGAICPRSFRPIVAGSLALLLGVGVANARLSTPAGCSGVAAGDFPMVCYQQYVPFYAKKLDTNDLTWSSVSGLSDVVTPQANSSNVEEFKFVLKGTGGTAGTPSASASGSTYTITSNLNSWQSFILDGGEKSIQLNDGNGKLVVDFADGNHDRTFSLNLTGGQFAQGAASFSFKGNIELVSSNNPTNGRAKFIAGFAKDMMGNITIQDKGVGKSDITFKAGANLRGNFEARSGINTLIFENGIFVGNLKASGLGVSNELLFKAVSQIKGDIAAENKGENKIGTSQGKFLTIKGNLKAQNGMNTIGVGGMLIMERGKNAQDDITIIAEGSDASNTIAAKMLFIDASAISVRADQSAGSNIIAGDRGAVVVKHLFSKGGENTIQFKEQQSAFTSTGNIVAVGSINNGSIFSGVNKILLENGEVDIRKDKTADTTSVWAQNGSNKIVGRTITIDVDSIVATGEVANANTSKNDITAMGDGRVEVSLIKAENGINTLKLKQGGSMTAKLITATNGANNIALGGSANGDSKLTANIIANGDGTNNILLENATWDSATIASGSITSNSGTNNLVLRKVTVGSNPPAQPSPYTQGADIAYRINTSGGANNIVTQGADTRMQINYGKSGVTTLIFAGSNDTATADSFEASATDANADKILGKTYQDGIKLTIQDKSISVGSGDVSFIETYGKFFRDKPDAPLLTLKTETTPGLPKTNNITLTGLAVGSLKALTSGNNATTGTTYNLNLSKDSAFVGSVDLSAATGTTINLIMDKGSKFLTDSDNLTMKNLTFNGASFDSSELLLSTFEQGNTIVDIATMGNDLGQLATRKEFRLLAIGDANSVGNNTGLEGADGFFRVYVNTNVESGNKLGGQVAANGTDTYGNAYSDRILVHEASGSGTNYIQAIVDSDMDITKVSYKGGGTETAGNIAVATVKDGTNVTFEGAKQLQGFDVVGTILTDGIKTNEYGKANTSTNGYTTYFVDSVQAHISLLNQKLTASALAANYDLYLANINSLNKRMGELRENTGAQGAWARVFNGMQSTNFALSTRAIYTTIQAGYDYTFGFKGASNYLGFALSYANSMSKLNEKSGALIDINNQSKSITGMNSNAFEFAIYNAYVQDGASKATGFKNGLYTDSIAKFSYIMSNLDITGENKLNTSNFAFTFSQELGYRFLLGKDKEFYIDPQAEITLGYLNQSNLTRVLGKAFLKANQDSIFTLRSRVGSSFGYKFDKFTQNKGFNSSLYLGTYFVSDVIAGGDIFMQSNLSQASFKALESTARFVLNLGTNFKIKDNTRIYFDFERSFGGRITTDYQLNLGVRYSFGTSKYTPYTESTQEAPKDSNTLKEVEPTQGYYIELLEKEDKKLTNKELKTLQNLKEELRIQTKTQNNKTLKTYLAGPFKDESKAKEAKTKLEGVIKELKSKGNILEVE